MLHISHQRSAPHHTRYSPPRRLPRVPAGATPRILLLIRLALVVIPPARRRRDRRPASFPLFGHPDPAVRDPLFPFAPPLGASGRAARFMRPARFAGAEGSLHNLLPSTRFSRLSLPSFPLSLQPPHCHPDRSEPAFSCARFSHAGSRSGGIVATSLPNGERFVS